MKGQDFRITTLSVQLNPEIRGISPLFGNQLHDTRSDQIAANLRRTLKEQRQGHAVESIKNQPNPIWNVILEG